MTSQEIHFSTDPVEIKRQVAPRVRYNASLPLLTPRPRSRPKSGAVFCVAEHVRQLEGESPFDKLMEVKSWRSAKMK